MPEAIEYVQELADRIGPRPATTDTEAEAADYIEGVFEARGLDVERQEFDCPRTYSWTYVAYHALTIGAAVLSGFLAWPAFVIALASAVLLFADLDTRFGLSRIMPKGPSQNIIGRHVPKARRGERMRRVIVVAHYDSARSSLAFSPGLVKNFNISLALMKWTTAITPLVILLGALPFTQAWRPWTWYAAIAVSAYLLFPLLINLHREFFMGFVDGANDNASGVAAMLAVLEAVVPEPEERPSRPHRRSAEAAYEADVVPDDAALEYRAVAKAAEPASAPSAASVFSGFDDVGWDDSDVRGRAGRTEEPETDSFSSATWPEEQPEGQERFDLGMDDEGAEASGEHRGREPRGLREWLGVGRGFDVRKAGKEIGSWDRFEADDDDEFGFKAGEAGEPSAADDDFAATEAARIRRRVTSGVDRSLTEKEIWFVATGAEEVGTCGMLKFLEDYSDEVKGALIINIDNVGSGTVHWVTEEGMARRYHCDRRLASTAKRIAHEQEWPIKGRPYRGLSTDATPALARRYRAMSVMAFDINGRLPEWHWHTDTTENVNPATVNAAAEFVTELIRVL